MKIPIAFGIAVCFCASVFGQGTAIRSGNGLGTNTTIYNGLTLRPGSAGITNVGAMLIYPGASVLGTVFNVIDTNGTGRLQLVGQNIFLNDTNGNAQLQANSIGVVTLTNIANYFIGDGGGLTNIGNSGSTVIYNGKVTFNSNVVVNALNFKTNAGAVTTLNLGNNYQFISTNNNIAYTGFTGILSGETNVQWCTVIWTNTSGALKTATFAGTIGDATHYCTNQTAFTVVRYPLAGTNVLSRPLN